MGVNLGTSVSIGQSVSREFGVGYGGLVGVEQFVNLLTSPRDFSDSVAWSLNTYDSASYNSDIAPNGNLEADTLTDSSPVLREVSQIVSIIDDGADYAASIFVKKTASDTNWKCVILAFSGGTGFSTGATFDTDSGTINITSGTPASYREMEDYDANYWRVKFGAVQKNGNTQIAFRVFSAWNDTGNAIADPASTGSGIWWQAQLEKASSVGPIIEP